MRAELRLLVSEYSGVGNLIPLCKKGGFGPLLKHLSRLHRLFCFINCFHGPLSAVCVRTCRLQVLHCRPPALIQRVGGGAWCHRAMGEIGGRPSYCRLYFLGCLWYRRVHLVLQCCAAFVDGPVLLH